MRITGVTPLVLGTPWRNLTHVLVDTDEGIQGVGEVRMVNHTDALAGYLTEAVPRFVIGADPFEIGALVSRMRRDDYARPGEIAMSGIAVIEMACWDIVGKALGQPVHRLLGGAVRDRIKAYANGWYTVERTPEEFHAAARRVLERGYLALKVDPFGAGWRELERAERVRAIALIEAVRDAIGPEAELLVEMHGRFSAAQAIAIARELEPFEPSWIEEPVPPDNPATLAKVAARVNIPVASGERIHMRQDFRELLESGALDVAQPDISQSGGILETIRLAGWLDAYDVLLAPHNVGGPVSTAAALQVAAVVENFKIQEHFNDFADAWVKAAASGLPDVVDGYFAVPEAPGLGVTLDEEFVRAHPREANAFNLFADDWHLRQQ